MGSGALYAKPFSDLDVSLSNVRGSSPNPNSEITIMQVVPRWAAALVAKEALR